MEDMEMPLYQSHKKVHALKILNVTINENGSAIITPEDHGYAPFIVPAEYVSKHDPKEGGYHVVYADGYRSFSPAEAFESGYTLIG